MSSAYDAVYAKAFDGSLLPDRFSIRRKNGGMVVQSFLMDRRQAQGLWEQLGKLLAEKSGAA